MSKGIDYSKWDKLQVSDDDDDASGDAAGGSGSGDNQARRPRVTRLDYPSRVTLGPDGVYLEDMPALARASPFAATTTATTTTAAATTAATAATPPAVDASNSAAVSAVHDKDDEDALLYSGLTRNGGRKGDSHLWAQTRDTVTVSFLVPLQTRAHDVRNFSVYSCSNSCSNSKEEDDEGKPHRAGSATTSPSLCAVAFDIVTRTTKTATAAAAAAAIDGDKNKSDDDDAHATMELHYVHTLRYPVKLDADLLDGCWQLHSLPSRAMRLLVIELHKTVIGVGMTLWWDRCLVDDTRSVIDTTRIADRSGSSRGGGNEAFARAWQEAHETFRQRMRQRKEQQQQQQQSTAVVLSDDDSDVHKNTNDE